MGACNRVISRLPPPAHMKNDSLKKFAALRTSLVNEKRQLEQRLAEINAVLGSETPAAHAPATPRRPSSSRAAKPRRARNAVSLKMLVKKVTAEKPLTKEQIAELVRMPVLSEHEAHHA